MRSQNTIYSQYSLKIMMTRYNNRPLLSPYYEATMIIKYNTVTICMILMHMHMIRISVSGRTCYVFVFKVKQTPCNVHNESCTSDRKYAVKTPPTCIALALIGVT